jgi:hypothetical protein
VHRVLGFGDSEPLPTEAGMVRDTLKGMRRTKRQRQRQAAPLRLGDSMGEGQASPDGVTLRALLDSCGGDLVGLRDAALLSLAYDGVRWCRLPGQVCGKIKLKPVSSCRAFGHQIMGHAPMI